MNVGIEKGWSFTNGLSLEITAKDVEGLDQASEHLQPGTIVAVPFLFNESDETRLRMVTSLRQYGFNPMPHIAARRISSRANLEKLLEGWATAARVDRILVIAGDCAMPDGPYKDSLAIIRSGLLQKYGIRVVGISGYPEGNPKIPLPILKQSMMDKLQYLNSNGVGVEIATQFGFSATPMLEWLARLRADGITSPVRLGIPGPANARTLLRYAAMCGVGASASVLTRYGLSITKLLGNAGPDYLVQGIAVGYDPTRHGEMIAHYYPFGGLKSLLTWLGKYSA